MLLLCRISCYICMNFMVMERRLFIFCFLAVVVWQSVALAAGTSSFTALTASLDEAIEAHRHYVAVREGRIARLKRQLLDADTANLSFFRWNGEIYKEYKAYICDSAIHYLRVNLDWAERYGQRNAALAFPRSDLYRGKWDRRSRGCGRRHQVRIRYACTRKPPNS